MAQKCWRRGDRSTAWRHIEIARAHGAHAGNMMTAAARLVLLRALRSTMGKEFFLPSPAERFHDARSV
jgi:hypothetical protein